MSLSPTVLLLAGYELNMLYVVYGYFCMPLIYACTYYDLRMYAFDLGRTTPNYIICLHIQVAVIWEVVFYFTLHHCMYIFTRLYFQEFFNTAIIILAAFTISPSRLLAKTKGTQLLN